MLYFTTDSKSLRTENHELITALRGFALLAGMRMSLRSSMLDAIHSRAWMRLARVLKSETPCNS